MELKFFAKPADLRKWFEKNHDRLSEQWVGFYKKGSGRPSITWPESVDEALCFGWIDGVRKSIDDESYKIRFTPRKKTSTWSAVNIKRVGELVELGLMHPSGLAAFERREEKRSRIYSYEQGDVDLDPHYLRQFKRNKKAWAFFESQPPSYRKTATHWVIRAKQESTRLKRLGTLIEDSAAQLRVAHLRQLKK